MFEFEAVVSRFKKTVKLAHSTFAEEFDVLRGYSLVLKSMRLQAHVS